MKVEGEGIGFRVRMVRRSFGLNRLEFALKLGTTTANISRIENGCGNISLTLLKLICEKYLINEEWLKNGSDEIFKSSESGQAAGTDGDLISRGALLREMAGIALNTEENVHTWLQAELLVEKAPALQDGTKRFVRCDCCQYCAQGQEGEFWCRSLEGLGGELHPEAGDGCCRGKRMVLADPEDEDC